MESTIPVFGIIWEPLDDSLYWLDLTTMLRAEGVHARLQVPIAQRLDPADVEALLEAMWRSTTGTPIAAALGSDDEELQESAVYDCWGLGRRDPRYLVLLRRVMSRSSQLRLTLPSTCLIAAP